MERLGITLAQANRYGWHNVAAFVRHLGQGSYLWAYKHPDEAAYFSPLHTAAQLADLYDLVNTARRDGKKGARAPKPYPRPWAKDKKRIGRGAIPVRDFDAWYYGG